MDFAIPKLLFIDVETTGFCVELDRIVEVAIYNDDDSLEPCFETLVRPEAGKRIANTSIHGISNRAVRTAPTFEEIASRLHAALLGAILVAHNADFDVRFIEASFQRVGCELLLPSICTLKLGRRIHPGAPLTLDALATHYSLSRGERIHSAAGDAILTRSIFRHLLARISSNGAHLVDRLQSIGVTNLPVGPNPSCPIARHSQAPRSLVTRANRSRQLMR